MKLLTDEVSVGDHFIKVGDYSRTVYVVHSLVDAHGFPQRAIEVGRSPVTGKVLRDVVPRLANGCIRKTSRRRPHLSQTSHRAHRPQVNN